MFEVKAIAIGFGRIPVIRGVDLDIRRGKFLGVLGHNGAGKTTLLKTLAGFLPATAGRVRFDGVDLTCKPPHLRSRAGLGYVPEGRRIFPALSVMENLIIAAARSGRPIEEVLAMFPRLKRLTGRPGGALSGGATASRACVLPLHRAALDAAG